MTRACQTVKVTAHEKIMLGLYRSISDDLRRHIDGLLSKGWSQPRIEERFRTQRKALGIGNLGGNHLDTRTIRRDLEAFRSLRRRAMSSGVKVAR